MTKQGIVVQSIRDPPLLDRIAIPKAAAGDDTATLRHLVSGVAGKHFAFSPGTSRK